MMKRALYMVAGHKLEAGALPRQPDGYFLKCLRCAKVRDEPPGSGRHQLHGRPDVRTCGNGNSRPSRVSAARCSTSASSRGEGGPLARIWRRA